jgi:hypothetical protein
MVDWLRFEVRSRECGMRGDPAFSPDPVLISID